MLKNIEAVRIFEPSRYFLFLKKCETFPWNYSLDPIKQVVECRICWALSDQSIPIVL